MADVKFLSGGGALLQAAAGCNIKRGEEQIVEIKG